ncbi:MAG: recombinase family protein [Oscillospiraceae bacterium]|nr:recombinase family protein [Oscillospiraceae bacterium]
MKIYGYARISTARQSLQRQIDNISAAYPTAEIIREVYTGTTVNRPAWNRLLEKVQKGDTIIFDSVSRISRDASEGVRQYMELYKAEINLIFLKEPMINTEVYKNAVSEAVPMTGTDVDLILCGVNQYLSRLAEKQIQIAFEQAEKEVQDLRTRTREGMKASGASEKISRTRTGKKFITAEHLINSIAVLRDCKAFGGSKKDIEVAEMLKTTRMTVFRLKRELQERMQAEQLTQQELFLILENELKEKKKQKKNSK